MMKTWPLALAPALALAMGALNAHAQTTTQTQPNPTDMKREQSPTGGLAPATAATVQEIKRQFPDNATPIADADLKAKLAGKTYALFTADGVKWTYEYKDNGFAKVKSSAGLDSMGPWRAEKGKICTQPRNMSMFCGEARLSGDVIYVRRENGEVVPLEAP